ncbi:MAG: T9SS type A sorting domain-containing protein [Chitinophagales bacterium]
MKTILLLALLPISFSLHAQTGLQRTYSTGIPNFSAGLLPSTSGYVLSGSSNFSYDSSWLNLVFLDAAGDVSSVKSWRASLPLTFINHADHLTSGYLFCGIGSPNLGPFHPYIAKTDNNGSVQWSKWFDNLEFSSHQLNAMVTNGNAFTVYSYPDGGSTGFYRIEGDETGSSFSALSVTYATPAANMRIGKAIPFSTLSDHLLIGSGSLIPTINGPDGLLIKMNTASVSWSKLFHFGSFIYFDGFSDAMITTGDNTIAVAYSQDDVTSVVTSYVVKLNSSGTIDWCKKLAFDNILEMFSIVETGSGDLMVCGINNFYDGILIKLSGNGDLLWARKWTPSIAPATYFTSLYRDAVTNEIIVSGTHDGAYVLLHLDENGNGCEFEDIIGLQVSDFVAVVADLPLAITPFTVTTQTENLAERISTVTTQDICQTGIENVIVENHPVLFPNPASEMISVLLPVTFGNATLRLFNVAGRKVYASNINSMSAEIAVGQLEEGIYLLEIISGDKVWREKVMVKR